MVQVPRSLVLALLLVSPLVAGCLSDLERERLTVSWEPSVVMADGPSLTLDGWPAQLLVGGTVSTSSGAHVEITGVEASYVINGSEHALTPVRLIVDGDAMPSSQVTEADTLVGDGDQLTISFLPAPGEPLLQPAGREVNLTMEVQWRYREGDRFDAGRLEADGNVTLQPTGGLGIGAAEDRDGQLAQLAFKAEADHAPNGTHRAETFAVRTSGKERLGPVEVGFSVAPGVVLAQPTTGAGIPDGDGYIIYRFGNTTGEAVAVLEIGEVSNDTPGPGALVALAVLALGAWSMRRRRG